MDRQREQSRQVEDERGAAVPAENRTQNRG